jgi:hypothetical protein
METDKFQWLTVKEFVAGPLKGKVSANSVYKSIQEGFIPHIRISKGTILIPDDALERMLNRDVTGIMPPTKQ